MEQIIRDLKNKANQLEHEAYILRTAIAKLEETQKAEPKPEVVEQAPQCPPWCQTLEKRMSEKYFQFFNEDRTLYVEQGKVNQFQIEEIDAEESYDTGRPHTIFTVMLVNESQAEWLDKVLGDYITLTDTARTAEEFGQEYARVLEDEFYVKHRS